VVECYHSVADNQVGKFADHVNYCVSRSDIAIQSGGDHDGGLGVNGEDDVAFDIAIEADGGGSAFGVIGRLLHGEVNNLDRLLKHLREHGIGRVDERLDEIELHGCTPAAAAWDLLSASPST